MLIKILSDLHSEIEYNDFIDDVPENSKDIILCLAGDIGSVKSKKLADLIHEFCNNYKAVLYVFGNHEFWNSSLTIAEDRFKQTLGNVPPNLFFMNRNSFQYEDIEIIGATLWYNIPPDKEFDLFRLNDYNKIRWGKSKTSPYQYKLNARRVLYEHTEDKRYLIDALTKSKATTKILLTHHHITRYYMERGQYAGDPMNFAYGNNLDHLIVDYDVKYVICGHTHDSYDDNTFGFRFVCNPKGYANFGYYFNQNFKPNLILEI